MQNTFSRVRYHYTTRIIGYRVVDHLVIVGQRVPNRILIRNLNEVSSVSQSGLRSVPTHSTLALHLLILSK